MPSRSHAELSRSRQNSYEEQTCEVPWLALVEVHLRDDVELDVEAVDLALQVVVHQLLVRRVEPEARRKTHRSHLYGRRRASCRRGERRRRQWLEQLAR